MKETRGMAQLVVLWALLLLGTLAAGFAVSMRTEAQAARNGIESLRAYYQARTGISLAAVLLSSASEANPAATRLEGGNEDASYVVEILGQGGKININFVSEDDLLEILKKGGMSDAAAENLRDAVLDWIDADDLPRPGGAEASEYALLREPLTPRNGYLASIEELRNVAGVTRELYDRFLSRVFTVHGNVSLGKTLQVNASEASGMVLGVLPGVSADAISEIMVKRSEGLKISLTDLADMEARGLLTQKGRQALSVLSPSRVFEITSTGRAGAGRGVVHTVRCLVSVDGRSGAGSVKVLRWVDLAARGEEW